MNKKIVFLILILCKFTYAGQAFSRKEVDLTDIVRLPSTEELRKRLREISKKEDFPGPSPHIEALGDRVDYYDIRKWVHSAIGYYVAGQDPLEVESINNELRLVEKSMIRAILKEHPAVIKEAERRRLL